jgi:protein ImuA
MSASPPDPQTIHPSLWRAHGLGSALGSACAAVRPSGFAALDAQLPGGGWPCRALTELLLPRPGLGEMRLLAPVLTATSTAVMLFDPPALPCAQALAQLGVEPRRLAIVQGREDLAIIHGREGLGGTPRHHRQTAADVLWALEHTLRSGALDVVLAWLPDRLGADVLRRLQLAAQSHDGPVFLLRGIGVRLRPSPAPLRLALHPGVAPDELVVQVLKRRGPTAEHPLQLNLPPVLPAAARARWQGAEGGHSPGPQRVTHHVPLPARHATLHPVPLVGP